MPGGWLGWAILLTVVGAFILMNLFRNKEEARRRRSPLRETGPDEEDNPPRQQQEPLTDFDRYLQDFQRRRQGREGGGGKPRPRPVPRPIQSVESRARRASSGSERRPPRSTVDAPLPRRPTAAGSEAIPYAIPVETPAIPARAIPVVVPVAPAPAFPATPSGAPAARGISVARSSRPVAKVYSFLGLLQSRQTLRNLIILREILDPPLSKRRRM
jgi:hypothetical protein